MNDRIPSIAYRTAFYEQVAKVFSRPVIPSLCSCRLSLFETKIAVLDIE